MSDGHEHDHDDAADAHDDHGFDGEPATALSPGENPTPGWLPAIGAALFVVAAIVFLVERDDAPPAPAPAQEAAPQIVATAAPPRAPMPGGPGSPAGAGTPNVRKLNPDQMKDVQKRIEEARKKLDGQAPPAPAPAPNGGK